MPLKAKALRPTSHVQSVPRCVFDGMEITYERLDILSALKEADGWMERLVIYDRDFAKLLEDKGYAYRNARGSYGHTDKLTKDVILAIEDALTKSSGYKPFPPKNLRKN